MRKVDRSWQLEYQRTEDETRYRVVEGDLFNTFKAVRMTFLDLGLAIQNESVEKLTILAQNEAPAPLSKEEWRGSLKSRIRG